MLVRWNPLGISHQLNTIQYNTIQYIDIENLYSAAIQKCPGALTTLENIYKKAVLSQRRPHDAPYICVPLVSSQSWKRVKLNRVLTPPLFNRNFVSVPVAPDGPCWGHPRAQALSYSAVKLFSKNSNLCDHDT